MNYTKSNSYTEHAATGQRMHDAAKAVPTQVSDSDLNMIIWSMMEVIKNAGLQGVDFSADNPDSYKVLLRAIQKVFAPLLSPKFSKRSTSLSGGNFVIEAGDSQPIGDLHFDYYNHALFINARRKADGKTVGVQIDFNLADEGHTDILAVATKDKAGRMSASDKAVLHWLAEDVVPQAAPPGLVSFFARNTAPAGWFAANGAAVSRTVYSGLFDAIGTTYGAGDGSTTFNLPDLRGEFIRGWDNGRGVDAGRVFGSRQGDAIRNITGFLSGTDRFSYFDGMSGALGLRNSYGVGVAASGTLAGYNDIDFDASRVVPTAGENRPRNVALLACIKY